ncbi:hypothetical protein DUI87_08493 [Hirundo rustica rustica]|uniref:Uncharacterized protein n=1 Tax=Hirundo rustica rustica TaxID=333673 RepID=A0A3M0KSL6_HIRRU|nr:hypothetical protein DUI87_08493 [Hirundo rustica rustica]
MRPGCMETAEERGNTEIVRNIENRKRREEKRREEKRREEKRKREKRREEKRREEKREEKRREEKREEKIPGWFCTCIGNSYFIVAQ